MDVPAAARSNPLLDPDCPPRFDLVEAQDVRPAVRKVLDSERERLTRLSGTDQPDIQWLQDTELMLERINDVWSPVSHLNSVASNPELREAYNECLQEITAFFSDLGQDAKLFAQFEKLAQDIRSEPEAELVRHSLRDFRLAGVALTGDNKEAFRAVSLELASKQAQFEQNLMDASDAFEHHLTDKTALAGLPSHLVERAATAAQERELKGWLLKLDPPSFQSIMTHADSRELRETYYRAWVTRASDQGDPRFDNAPLIEEILKLRQRSAELLGFDNFAALSLAKKMAESEQQVLGFLDDLAARSRSFAEAEFTSLEAFAERKLEAWDVAYYSEKLRQQTFSIGDEELRAYFPVPKVMQGLFDLVERLYGLRIEETAVEGLWHETARAYRITNADGSEVGMLLADFFARPNKRGGAWMDVCANRSRLGSIARNPVAHLVCNFAPPAAGAPSYITHNDVVTLFHEFGHSLHHLLTEIDYPSLAGINGVAWDAVELPSQFFENYAWLPEVLRSVSSHRDTGEPLPDSKIETLIASRTFLAGLAMARQLEFALFDFRLHSSPDSHGRDEVQAILEEVRRDICVIPTPGFNRFQCSFAHIFAGGYAAGYYSYKWAEVLAADAFSAFEETDAFDAATASRFRGSILAIGGSRDAMTSFVDFRGRPPELGPLLRQAGITQ